MADYNNNLRPKDLHVGMRLYEWTLRQSIPDTDKLNPIMRNRWRVECSCGVRETLPAYYLLRKSPKMSCGHLNKGLPTLYKHEYACWTMMRRRCNHDDHVSYKHYGGRGIKVCPQWDSLETGFEQFMKDMGPSPTPQHSLDRFPDNDGLTGYWPGNVRWATATEQRANQRPPGSRKS